MGPYLVMPKRVQKQTTVREGSFGGKIHSVGLVASFTLRKEKEQKLSFEELKLESAKQL